MGHQVHTRHNGQEGLAAAESLQPEVILLDIGMPGLNGYDTCRLIRQQLFGQSMVLIALTGFGQEEDKRLSQEAGFNAHLVKPVDLGALIELLATLPGSTKGTLPAD
jgi:CheY-like chemotaxis protein